MSVRIQSMDYQGWPGGSGHPDARSPCSVGLHRDPPDGVKAAFRIY